MSANRELKRPIAVGVDVGATRLRLTAVDGERTVARLVIAVSRIVDVNRFLQFTWKNREWNRRNVGALVVATRGIWTPRERRALASRLAPLASRVEVLSDAQAALLGALGAERPGLLVLAGTGSIVIGRDPRGRWARAGGLGPLLGDEGSAFWIGREWLRATPRGEDFLPIRRLVTRPDAVPRIAALAPSVLRRARRGDRRARLIVREAQAHLARLAVDVARRLRLPPPVAVSWAGGVMDDPGFRDGVKRAVARNALSTRWIPPAAEPVAAAVALAQRVARILTPRRSEQSGKAGAPLDRVL
ncbi:MAG: BadF/BadG/BcrA/BcrD ATPase family protein [Gammaproteobacteria bacterium]